MLIGDFSLRLSEFAAGGSFGVEEWDDHFKPLDARLAAFGVDPAGRLFHTLLSFLLNQGTEWDAFVMPYRGDPALDAVLAHGRHVPIPPETGAGMIVLRKPPIRHRVIELTPSFQAPADPGAVRAPAACFVACDDVALFREHAPALRRNRHDGQAYGFLLRFDVAETDGWLAAFRPMFEPFHVCFWLHAPDADGGSAVVTLITTGLAPYEI